MKTISVSVSEKDYDAFRKAAREEELSIAQLIRAAMSHYRAEHLKPRSRLEELPVLAGHRQASELPSRDEIYDEMFRR